MLLAMEDFTSVHNLKPSKTDALLKRALFYFNKKSWLMAISDFTELMQQEPLNSTIRSGLFYIFVIISVSFYWPNNFFPYLFIKLMKKKFPW